MRILAIVITASFLAACGSGGDSCDDTRLAGLIVEVQAASGGRVCDATVVATDGSYTETLFRGIDTIGCAYLGAYERAGNYSITATTADGEATATQQVEPFDECHVMPVFVTLTMPAP